MDVRAYRQRNNKEFNMKFQLSTRLRLAIASAALLTIGAGLGAAITQATAPIHVMAPGVPIHISSLAARSSQTWFGEPITTVRGRLVEVYGNRFVLDDGSGRVLVEAGHGHERNAPLPLGQVVTAQGRYENGLIRAMFLVGPDGQAYAVDHRHGGRSHHGEDRHGWRDVRPNMNKEPGLTSSVGPVPSLQTAATLPAH
jgi:hypothetical protein